MTQRLAVACAWLLTACTVEADLGAHDSGSEASVADAQAAADTAARDRDATAPAAAGPGDGALARDAAPDADSDAAGQLDPQGGEDDGDRRDDEPGTLDAGEEHPGDAGASHEVDEERTDAEASSDAEEGLSEDATWCAARETGDVCTACEIEQCCEELRNCFGSEGCACRVECREADLPELCVEQCPEQALGLEALAACDRELCHEPCE